MMQRFTATAERYHTEPQLRKLWAEARERCWFEDQVYGRATEINPDVDIVGLRIMSTIEMSELIEAVMTEAIWVDPRQQRLPL